MPTKPRTGSALASNLRVGVARLARRLRQEGAGEDATPSQLTALATLYHRGPMTVGELAGAERVKPPSMTRIVAGLEERGLVTRVSSAHDRRVQHVSVTDAGRAAHEEYRKRRDAWLCRQLTKLDPDERELLMKAADVLDRIRKDEA
jgi:DNA-binding MarR family transcriptional regulator